MYLCTHIYFNLNYDLLSTKLLVVVCGTARIYDMHIRNYVNINNN